MTKVIKVEFETLETLKINDVLLTCDTSLEIFHDEFNRLSNMDDDLFTYKVEIVGIANVPCNLNRDDDLEQQVSQESDNDIEYDPSNVEFTAWLASKNFNYKMIDHYTKRTLWIYLLRGDDDVELTDEESFDFNDKGEVAGIFRIETNVFDFETPLCRTFKEFNYLLQINPDVLTKDIDGFKTYKEYKDDWIYEWNKDVTWVYKKPLTDTGGRKDRYCNGGNFPGTYIVGNKLRYQDLEWYEALKASELKEEALRNKAIMEGLINDDVESNNEDDEERCELFDDATQELPVCTMRRFEMIKYSLRQDKEYVAVKEDEYEDLTSTSKDACRAYQEIFRMIDEGWMDVVKSNENDEVGEVSITWNIMCDYSHEVEVCEEQKQSMEDIILELVEICSQKELLCMHDNVDDLIESALNSKLLSINSQRLDKEKQKVKNVVEQPAERGNRTIESLKNFRSHQSNKEPEYSSSMGYEHPNTTPETESDEIIKSGVEELVPILSKNEVTLEDKRECDLLVCENSLVCDNHSDIFSDSNNDDDISVYNDDFKEIEYVEASLSDPEIVSVEEENVVQQQEEEVDLEDISQIQDVVLRDKLLSIIRLITNIKSLNDNPTLDRVLNSFVSNPISEESDNSLLDNFRPNSKLFAIIRKRREVERLINVVKNDISDNSTTLLEEADLYLSDNLIPSGIENFADDSGGDIRFLKALLIDDSIPFPNNESFESEDNPSILRPPPEPPDAKEEIPVVMNDRDEFDDDYSFFFSVGYLFQDVSFFSPRRE
uniref:Uncharacterized protein n=1 Tax=Tanacetum cinerariifolium TaxID=118510 RepID=A0A6L2LFY8_TANCI|nr:hypothetical protein [Tanacetum cinerariifolium]